MKNVDWPKGEVAKIAASSGKPLEVACAQAFITAGWNVDLGSYFTDGDRVREFDVLATRDQALDDTKIPLRVRALVSCKGFRPTCSPLAYSVSTVPPCAPRVLSHQRINPGHSPLLERYGRIEPMEKAAAAVLLEASGLAAARPLVAFDVIEREETIKKQKPEEPQVVFRSVGDRNLYEGIDSALKATFFWTFTDNQSGTDYVSLYVPLLLLADPFWDVCIDGGSVGDVELRRRGYHSCRYPIGSLQVSEVTTLVWSAEELPALLTALDGLLRWFKSNARSYMPTR